VGDVPSSCLVLNWGWGEASGKKEEETLVDGQLKEELALLCHSRDRGRERTMRLLQAPTVICWLCHSRATDPSLTIPSSWTLIVHLQFQSRPPPAASTASYQNGLKLSGQKEISVSVSLLELEGKYRNKAVEESGDGHHKYRLDLHPTSHLV
jgi:hypothetical protein